MLSTRNKLYRYCHAFLCVSNVISHDYFDVENYEDNPPSESRSKKNDMFYLFLIILEGETLGKVSC